MPISKNDVALITGAASGFGRALAVRLVEEGGRVIILDINEAGATKLADELNAKAGSKVAVAFKVDTTSTEQQLVAFEQGKAAFGRIDYVFANAGISERPFLPPVFDPATATTRPIVPPNFATLNIDLIGQLTTAALALQYFERQDVHATHGFRGKLVLTASVFGLYPSRVMPMYSASKAGIVMFMRSAATYYENKGITVNAICPNLTATGIGPPTLFQGRKILTSIDLVVDQFMSLLGGSKATGQAIGISQDHVWVHAMDTTEYVENKEGCDVVDEEVGKHLGIEKFWT